ncbi:MAG: ubiquinone/menaquinone biosynthesis methyltransferase [Acidimicrobiales bacterium]
MDQHASGSSGGQANRRSATLPPAYDLSPAYDDARPLPQGQEKVAVVRSMFDSIAPRYDLVNRIMTFSLDRGWRRRTVRSLGLRTGARVLDVACGTGDLCRELRAGGARPIGLDLSWGMLAHARTCAPLLQGDGLALPLPDACLDGAVSGFALRNVADLPVLFTELARVVRPGGRIALLEVAEPKSALLRFGHRAYFGHVVPWIGALLSDGNAYRYLPRSVAYLPEPGQLLEMLREAGWAKPERFALSGGVAQLLVGTRQ